jgi:hypothetical protein
MNHPQHHNPDATWETTLVIPEAVKSVEERTLEVLLRIEELLTKLVRSKNLEALAETDADLLGDVVEEKKPRAKRK